MRAPAEEHAHGNISVKTYFKYFVAGGGYIFTSIVLSFLPSLRLAAVN